MVLSGNTIVMVAILMIRSFLTGKGIEVSVSLDPVIMLTLECHQPHTFSEL